MPTELNALWACLAIAMAASSISITVTQTELFTPFRTWSQCLGHMLNYLFQCFYCLNHWVVAAFILLYQPLLLKSEWLPVDLLLSWFLTVTLSTFVSGLMFKSFLMAMAKKQKEAEMKPAAPSKQD